MKELNLNYDIIIIGSGAGGGTIAKELAPLCQSGARIALLEWGGSFSAHDNLREEVAMAKKYYFDAGGFQTTSQDVTLAFAKAVGGSTTVYTGTSLTAPAKVFRKWGISEINETDLKPRYQKYIEENNVHLTPQTEINENNRLFYSACKKLGWHVEQFPLNIRGCQGLATCNLGCAVLAKQGTAVVQIPKAREKGVDLFPFCRAHQIEDHAVVVEVVPPEHELDPAPLAPGMYHFKAKTIIIACGAVHSPALLLRSFGKQLSPALGRYFTCHPALILLGQHSRPIQNMEGHPKCYYCGEFAESRKFFLETCFYFPFTASKSLALFGPSLDEFMQHFPQLQMILSLAIDSASPHNRVEIDGRGAPRVHYALSDGIIAALTDSIKAAAQVFFTAGAERIHSPASREAFIERQDEGHLDKLVQSRFFKRGKVSVSAAHLMGGCRMGSDPKTSVTDSWGRVHGKPGLYVADASLFPDSLEINPYLTIMALADRVADAVKKDLGVTA